MSRYSLADYVAGVLLALGVLLLIVTMVVGD